jgi:protein-disulfide isomerase
MARTPQRTVALLLALFALVAAPLRSTHASEPSAPTEALPNDGGPVPVTARDPQIGEAYALVTLVVFSDFQCPFCARIATTLQALEKRYDRKTLRVVWKNAPLPFHPHARPAAEAGMTILRQRGSEAFWRFHDSLFASQGPWSTETWAKAASSAGVSEADLQTGREESKKKLEEDIELGRKLRVNGTPTSFVNGVRVGGAQPEAAFVKIIDEELTAAKALLAKGVTPSALYAKIAADNAAKEPPADKEEEDDEAAAKADAAVAYQVPVGTSPVHGPNDALVTLVEFADFQCPFCVRVSETVEALRREYGSELRVVFKHNPLPFHPRAIPAAALAIEARAERGDAAFWQVHNLLDARAGKLEDDDLRAVAKQAGLDVEMAMNAIDSRKYAAEIARDQDLADEVQANGTPHFFINGRRLAGAQPIEKFRAVIDAELATAKAIVARGVAPALVYETLQKTAKAPPAPEKKAIPLPTSGNPSKGPANAKVTVQIFSDFECPFCARAEPTLAELERAFPGQLRFVWRNLPLPFHAHAKPAAEAAMEAFAQKGPKGFWAMHDLLFENAGKGGLERTSLDGYAKTLGLDLARFAASLDQHTHADAIDAEAKLANEAGVSGTPGFAVNGYWISGAQPIGKFKSMVSRALAEAK